MCAFEIINKQQYSISSTATVGEPQKINDLLKKSWSLQILITSFNLPYLKKHYWKNVHHDKVKWVKSIAKSTKRLKTHFVSRLIAVLLTICSCLTYFRVFHQVVGIKTSLFLGHKKPTNQLSIGLNFWHSSKYSSSYSK